MGDHRQEDPLFDVEGAGGGDGRFSDQCLVTTITAITSIYIVFTTFVVIDLDLDLGGRVGGWWRVTIVREVDIDLFSSVGDALFRMLFLEVGNFFRLVGHSAMILAGKGEFYL